MHNLFLTHPQDKSLLFSKALQRMCLQRFKHTYYIFNTYFGFFKQPKLVYAPFYTCLIDLQYK